MSDYLRDPEGIYRASFAAIRAEADLGGLPADIAPMAVRMIHACGMTDIVRDLAWSPDAVVAGREALTRGAPILVDTEMVLHGITRARLPGENTVICTLNDPTVAGRARRIGTTRSAAAVDLWEPIIDGAVVAIGNAPTALFHLLQRLAEWKVAPAVILGFPVGFVGAVESKEALAASPLGVPFVTLHGRRGGSALAAAAVNALTGRES